MKKFFFITLTLFAFTGWSQSLSLGPKAYVNLARFTGDIEKPGFILGGAFGGGINLRLEENLGFEVDLLYSQQGTTGRRDTEVGTYQYTINADYLILPVLAKFHANETLFLQMGIQPGFLLKSEWNLPLEDKNLKDKMNSFDLGINLGIGVYITKNMVLDGRYYLGLTDVNKTLFSDATMSNNVFRFGLSYFFKLKDHQKTEELDPFE